MVSGEPILVYPDPSKPNVLFTDASKYAWLCILTQEYTYEIDGKTIKILHPISCQSGLFKGSPTKLGMSHQRSLCHLHVYKEIGLLFG